MTIVKGPSVCLATAMDLSVSGFSDMVDMQANIELSINIDIPADTHKGVLTFFAGHIPDTNFMVPQFCSFLTGGTSGTTTTGIIATLASGVAFSGIVSVSFSHYGFYCLSYVADGVAPGAGLLTAFATCKS